MSDQEEVTQTNNEAHEEQTNQENPTETFEPEKTEIENSEQKQEESNTNEIKNGNLSKKTLTNNNKISSSQKSRNLNQKKMKKLKTAGGYHYYDPNAKKNKFNQQKFEKQMNSFKEWEKKKNEKLKNKLIEKQQKEYEDFTKKNIHYKKNMDHVDTSDVINRLYQKDIKNRKEKQKTLRKVYEPPFHPTVYKQNYLKYGYVTSTIDNKNNFISRNKRSNNLSMGKRNLTNDDVNNYRTDYGFNDEEEDDEENLGYTTVRNDEEIQDRFRQMLFFNKPKTTKPPETKKLNVSIGKRKVRQTA